MNTLDKLHSGKVYLMDDPEFAAEQANALKNSTITT